MYATQYTWKNSQLYAHNIIYMDKRQHINCVFTGAKYYEILPSIYNSSCSNKQKSLFCGPTGDI